MLFAALALVGLGVLSAHATSIGEPKPTIVSVPDGDWHIGCDEPGHCGYYQDHPKRSGSGYRDFIPDTHNDDPKILRSKIANYIKDHQGIETRCSLTSFNLVEKFNGQHWVHHYKCPSGTSCNDILGSGACRAGNDYTVPTKAYLWTFTCPDVSNEKTCRFSDSTLVDARDLPKPFESYLSGATRCSPSGQAVQYREGEQWKDIYSCTTGATCVENRDHAGCKPSQSLTSRSLPDDPQVVPRGPMQGPLDPEDELPTRCDPSDFGYVQAFDALNDKWVRFHKCQYSDGCFDWVGRARCADDHGIFTPSAKISSDVGGGNPAQIEPAVGEEGNQEPLTTQSQIRTRCDPDDSKLVQYLHPSHQWLRFYECQGRCKLFPEFAACEEHQDKYVVPSPPMQGYQKHIAGRGLPPTTGRWSSKCDISGQPSVTTFFRGKAVGKGDCPSNSPCRDSGVGFAMCEVGGHSYLMGDNGQIAHLPRGDPYNPTAPDFHTFDTRCNPNDSSEVQRYEAGRWVHHIRCIFEQSCVDVDGYGACRVGDNLYLLPAANTSSVQHGEQANTLRVKTICNKSNASEILQYNGFSWKPRGVCLPPYECYDFFGAADFALCARPDPQSGKMWLPWPALSRSINNGQVTRCKDERTLEEFKDNAWVPFRRCLGAFKCRNVEGSSNGGCAADGLYDIVAHGGAGVIQDVPLRLPKRNGPKNGLLKNSEKLTEEGETLIDEGNDLTAQSDAPTKAIFDSRDAYSNLKDFFAMQDPNPPADQTESNDTSTPNLSLIPPAPPATGRVYRSGSNALVDDSKAMHQQGEHLVEEGNRLVAQGKKLLKLIWGERTDEYVKNITQRRGKAQVTGDPITISLPMVPKGHRLTVGVDDDKVGIGIEDAQEYDDESSSDSE